MFSLNRWIISEVHETKNGLPTFLIHHHIEVNCVKKVFLYTDSRIFQEFLDAFFLTCNQSEFKNNKKKRKVLKQSDGGSSTSRDNRINPARDSEERI